MKRFAFLLSAAVLLVACRPLDQILVNAPSIESKETEWTSINGPLGLEISYPMHFSLDMETDALPQRVTLANNRYREEQLEIVAFDHQTMKLCAADGGTIFTVTETDLPLMEGIALAIKDANIQNTHVELLDPHPIEGGVAFRAYGSVVIPCGRIGAAQTDVILLPREDTLYVITYDANAPLMDEIARRIKMLEETPVPENL